MGHYFGGEKRRYFQEKWYSISIQVTFPPIHPQFFQYSIAYECSQAGLFRRAVKTSFTWKLNF